MSFESAGAAGENREQARTNLPVKLLTNSKGVYVHFLRKVDMMDAPSATDNDDDCSSRRAIKTVQTT